MGRTIGVISIKGGVGKTSVSSALACDLALNHNKKVLLVDTNYSAPNLGLHMDILEPKKTIHDVLNNKYSLKESIQSRFGVDVVPGDYFCNSRIDFLRLRNKLRSVKDDYDFIVLDSSPSLNDELLSSILASDSLFLVSTPDYPTLSCSLRAAQIAKLRGRPISGIILNKVRDPKFELNLKDMEEVLNIPVVAKIPDDTSSLRAVYTRIPIPLYNKNGKFGKEIGKLSLALVGKKERRSFLSFFKGDNFKREEVNRQVLKESFYRSLFEN
jgi:MinD-like ATPase involved in chromosome partitioning or flagellar assembly